MAYRKLGRLAGHRKMLLRNIVTSFLKEGKMETTAMRAKELQSLAEKMITLGKRGDLHARRQALAYLLDETVVSKLFQEISPRYQEKNGGYTRITKTGFRQGDGAPMVRIELV
jgi:large subunit ribosomal protein L17